MRARTVLSTNLVGMVVALAGTGPGMAQQVTGVLGSPGAATTIDGKQLPAI